MVQIRDVVWIGKSYNDWLKNKAQSNDNDKDEDIGDSMEEYVTLNTKERALKSIKSLKKKVRISKCKVYCAFKQLESSYNPDVTNNFNHIEQGSGIILDQANIVLFS
jgi:hypothetical protein